MNKKAYTHLIFAVGVCCWAPTQIRTFGLTMDANSHALHGEWGKELVMLNDRLISASLVASDVRRRQSLSSFHTLEHPTKGLTMIYEFSKCRQRPPQKPTKSSKKNIRMVQSAGGLNLLTFSGRCCYSRREDLGPFGPVVYPFLWARSIAVLAKFLLLRRAAVGLGLCQHGRFVSWKVTVVLQLWLQYVDCRYIH